MTGEADQTDAPKRLIVVSSGNIPDDAIAAEVDDPALFPMEDPAQARLQTLSDESRRLHAGLVV